MPTRTLSVRPDGALAAVPVLRFLPGERRDPEPRTARTADRGSNRCPVRLVRKAQRGDEKAFAALWERYAPTVRGILLTMFQPADAEDLSQDVAVSALQALPSLEKPDRFPSWLCSIARNAGRDALALRRRSLTAAGSDTESMEAPPEGDPTEAGEILAQIRGLPECYRVPLMLRLVLEMSGPEIARHTGMTAGSVRVNLCRGMKLLRSRMKDWE